MNPERWQQVKHVLAGAIEREPAERASFIARACSGDESLLGEVESLLVYQDGEASFIEEYADEFAAREFKADDAALTTGQPIGHYKIEREIGRGGMGAVYLAVRADDQYQKRVAIKLVKRGMDTDSVLRRFRNERQILANLDHPNIARLLDGGTTADGLPYFVMEYIEGVPVNVYCDAQTLSIIERLELFRTICAAVQYAHQNLVIHRDIKPSNILVTADGTPKLLDFGIAKLLDPASVENAEATQTAFRVMTPEYASPEQLRGQNVTTTSDVYSLGVLLYELLTGQRPYKLHSRAPEEIRAVICEQEPERPSQAIADFGMQNAESKDNPQSEIHNPKSLRGDIDNTVLMALRKDPARRYSSVGQFSEDIRRYLEGLPVVARKDTFHYRAGKFVQRNKIGVIAASLVALALVVGIMTTAWQARVARVERDRAEGERARAERRFNDVRRLANLFMFKYHDAIEKLPGSTPVREMLVKDALEYLDNLAQEANGDPALQRELATAYLKVGDVQGRPYKPNLGDTAGALASYGKAVAIFEALSKTDAMSADNRRDLSLAYESIGNIQMRHSDASEAVETQRKAVMLREQLLKDDPANVESGRLLAAGYLYLGDAMVASGDIPAALESYRQTLPIRERLYAADETNAADARSLARSYQRIGNVLMQTSALKDDAELGRAAWETHRKALLIREKLSAADPTNAQDRRDLADEYVMKAPSQMAAGDAREALSDCRKALVIFEALLKIDPTNAEARRDLAHAHRVTGMVLDLKIGDVVEALKHYRQSLEIFEQMAASDPTNIENYLDLARGYRRLGETLEKVNDNLEAIASYRRSAMFNEKFLAANPTNALVRPALATDYFKLGKQYAMLASDTKTPRSKRMDHWREARSWYQRSLDTLLELRASGALAAAYAVKPDEAAREIARCDAALDAYD